MRSCLAAVKASMLVIQRSLETISATLQAELQETLSNLLDCYVHILTDGPFYFYGMLQLSCHHNVLSAQYERFTSCFCVEEFIQCVQTTAGMAVVLMIKCVMGCGDEVAAVVS